MPPTRTALRARLAAAALPLGVLALLGLLVGLGAMQYRWLEEIKQAELQRRRAAARAQAEAFARDLDREVGRLGVLLSVDQRALAESRFEELGDRLRAWRSESPLRAMLKDVWRVRATDGPAPRAERFDEQASRFVAEDWPADLERVRERLARSPAGLGAGGVQADAPVLLMPVLAAREMTLLPPAGKAESSAALNRFALHVVQGPAAASAWIALRFDLDALQGQVLPGLAARHFGSGEGGEYHLSIVRAADPAGAPVYQTPGAPPAGARVEVETALFAARLDDVDGAVLAHLSARRAQTGVGFQRRGEPGAGPAGAHAANGRGSAPTPPGEAVAADARTAGEAKAPRNTFVFRMASPSAGPGGGAWRLRVVHREGSLEAAVTAAQRRQWAAAAGILAVLAGSVALLALSQRRAHALLVRQAEFVAGVSHELRTPLAVIRAAAENLRDGVVASPEQTRRYGETLADEGHRLSEMVEQLLEFAGADAPERARRRVAVPVAPLLEQAARQAQLAADDIAVEWRLAPELPALLGEPAALQRVFTNLLANARRHGEGRAVVADARAEGARVQITVSDRGPGLADADRARLFEPFYRGARAVEQQVPGSGLGLSVVRRVVEAHDGRIHVEDVPGGGAAFVVELPAALAESQAEAADEPQRGRS